MRRLLEILVLYQRESPSKSFSYPRNKSRVILPLYHDERMESNEIFFQFVVHPLFLIVDDGKILGIEKVPKSLKYYDRTKTKL